MRQEILMPTLSEEVEEGVLVTWFVVPGAPVRAGELVAEVQVEKVSEEVHAPADGTLVEALVGQGDVVRQGAPIAILEVGAAEAVAPQAPPRAAPAAAAPAAGRPDTRLARRAPARPGAERGPGRRVRERTRRARRGGGRARRPPPRRSRRARRRRPSPRRRCAARSPPGWWPACARRLS